MPKTRATNTKRKNKRKNDALQQNYQASLVAALVPTPPPTLASDPAPHAFNLRLSAFIKGMGAPPKLNARVTEEEKSKWKKFSTVSPPESPPLPELPREIIQVIFDMLWADVEPLEFTTQERDYPRELLCLRRHLDLLTAWSLVARWVRRPTTGELIGKAVRAMARADTKCSESKKIAGGATLVIDSRRLMGKRDAPATVLDIRKFLPRLEVFYLHPRNYFYDLREERHWFRGCAADGYEERCRDRPGVAFVSNRADVSALTPSWQTQLYVIPTEEEYDEALDSSDMGFDLFG